MSSLARSVFRAVPRGLAVFLGGFALLNLLGGLRSTGFDANLWWIDLRFLPRTLGNSLLALSALCLLGFGLRPQLSTWRRWLTLVCVGALVATCAFNAVTFYFLLGRGSIHNPVPVSLSLLLELALGSIFVAALRSRQKGKGGDPAFGRSGLPPGRVLLPSVSPSGTGAKELLAVFAVAAALLFIFPLAQMLCFGKTDYRRPADVAVVLGARVYADGRPSDALADRVRTACQLYRDGLARKLLFSGGPGDGAIHETEAMKRLAIQLGVKPQDILVDPAGLNTLATVRNSENILAGMHVSRVLAVSHFYHLPRIKLAWQREGWEVYTVPAKESYLLRQTPYNMAREVAALWVYYLRPLGTTHTHTA